MNTSGMYFRLCIYRKFYYLHLLICAMPIKIKLLSHDAASGFIIALRIKMDNTLVYYIFSNVV